MSFTKKGSVLTVLVLQIEMTTYRCHCRSLPSCFQILLLNAQIWILTFFQGFPVWFLESSFCHQISIYLDPLVAVWKEKEVWVWGILKEVLVFPWRWQMETVLWWDNVPRPGEFSDTSSLLANWHSTDSLSQLILLTTRHSPTIVDSKPGRRFSPLSGLLCSGPGVSRGRASATSAAPPRPGHQDIWQGWGEKTWHWRWCLIIFGNQSERRFQGRRG